MNIIPEPYRPRAEADAAQYFYVTLGVPAGVLSRMASGRFSPIAKGIRINGVLHLPIFGQLFNIPVAKRRVPDVVVQGHLIEAAYLMGQQSKQLLTSEQRENSKRQIKSELARSLRMAGMNSTDAERTVGNFVRSLRNV